MSYCPWNKPERSLLQFFKFYNISPPTKHLWQWGKTVYNWEGVDTQLSKLLLQLFIMQSK